MEPMGPTVFGGGRGAGGQGHGWRTGLARLRGRERGRGRAHHSLRPLPPPQGLSPPPPPAGPCGSALYISSVSVSVSSVGHQFTYGGQEEEGVGGGGHGDRTRHMSVRAADEGHKPDRARADGTKITVIAHERTGAEGRARAARAPRRCPGAGAVRSPAPPTSGCSPPPPPALRAVRPPPPPPCPTRGSAEGGKTARPRGPRREALRRHNRRGPWPREKSGVGAGQRAGLRATRATGRGAVQGRWGRGGGCPPPKPHAQRHMTLRRTARTSACPPEDGVCGTGQRCSVGR